MKCGEAIDALHRLDLRLRTPKAQAKYLLARLLNDLNCAHMSVIVLLAHLETVRPDLTGDFGMILGDLTAARGRCGKTLQRMKEKKK